MPEPVILFVAFFLAFHCGVWYEAWRWRRQQLKTTVWNRESEN